MTLPTKNQLGIEQTIRSLLVHLGEDPEREGLKDTPKRVAKLYSDILDGAFHTLPEFPKFRQETYDNMVIVRHVPFYAFCEHHLLPFFGRVSIGYKPDKSIIGLSKLVRIFRYYSKRITIQERLTEQAADALVKHLEPHGIILHVTAEHMCMSLRGIKSPGSITTTIATRGCFKEDLALQTQFLEDVHHAAV